MSTTARDGLPRAGLIGLGTMGAPMAANVLERLGAVTVWARRPESAAALVARGATLAPTPRELVAETDVLISVLPDLPQLEALLDGDDGLLAGTDHPLVLVVSSTSSAARIRELGDRLHAETDGRVRVVDAPVSGGEDGAVAGTLSVMVGGADDDVRRAMPVLDAVGTAVHLGPLGSGEVAKSCNQLIVAATIMALGEAAVIAERSGLELGPLFELLGGGYAGSRILQTRGDRIVQADYRPSGLARYMVKDLGFALDQAAAVGVTAPQLERLRSSFAELVDRGFGDQDIAVTRAFVEDLSRGGGSVNV